MSNMSSKRGAKMVGLGVWS
uniref:Uncharacterized protein n=1 Tax=Rhizophora mucronata TaxID=61149 RepID=A0A2P2MKL1_RHIMU